MTDLSPAAQAVLDAYNKTYESDRHAIAAALRAVVCGFDYVISEKVLAIAAELEGHQ
jgi:hypothetical protein